MSFLSTLTVKPLLIAIGVLVMLLLASNAGWLMRANSLEAQRDMAKANADAADADRDGAYIERDAWKAKAGELAAANKGAQENIESLIGELEKQQGENLRLQESGRRAVAAAQAEAAEADRALKRFIDRYAEQLRHPDCAGALSAVQQACPALEGY